MHEHKEQIGCCQVGGSREKGGKVRVKKHKWVVAERSPVPSGKPRREHSQ